jgi:hypothetical protein
MRQPITCKLSCKHRNSDQIIPLKYDSFLQICFRSGFESGSEMYRSLQHCDTAGSTIFFYSGSEESDAVHQGAERQPPQRLGDDGGVQPHGM